MVYKQKLTKIGNSYGITIPKELREKLNLKPGKDVYIGSEDNVNALTVSDKPMSENIISPEFFEIMQNASKKYSKALQELAKR